jgi:hypothetical protein
MDFGKKLTKGFLKTFISSKIKLIADKKLVSKISSIEKDILGWRRHATEREFAQFSIPLLTTDESIKIVVKKHTVSKVILLFYLKKNTIIKDGDFVLIPTLSKTSSADISAYKDLNTKKLVFDGFIDITYIYEKEEPEYVSEFRKSSKKTDVQVSRLSLNDISEVVFYPNGYYEPTEGLNIEKYWTYEKVDKMLPHNFEVKR